MGAVGERAAQRACGSFELLIGSSRTPMLAVALIFLFCCCRTSTLPCAQVSSCQWGARRAVGERGEGGSPSPGAEHDGPSVHAARASSCVGVLSCTTAG
jgi:hypothetical protein